MVEAALLRLTEACLDAPLCPCPWTHVAEAIARELDGIAVTITLAPGWSPHGPGFAAGIDRSALEANRQYYHQLNPWGRASSYYPAGYFGSGFSMISPAQLRRTEYYTDWLRPAGLGSEIVFGGLLVVRDGVDELLVGLFRRHGAREPRREEFELGRRMMPQLKRTFLLLEQMQQGGAEQAVAKGMAPSPIDTDARHAAAPRMRTSLIPRERDVLAIVAKGLGYRECAALLDVGSATVKTHLRTIYRKLHISSRAEAAREAMLLGLID